jgi:hypothetical protein
MYLYKQLFIIVLQYEEEIGDGKGFAFWNWVIDKYSPVGFDKVEEVED